jgi:hypothetical protein
MSPTSYQTAPPRVVCRSQFTTPIPLCKEREVAPGSGSTQIVKPDGRQRKDADGEREHPREHRSYSRENLHSGILLPDTDRFHAGLP